MKARALARSAYGWRLRVLGGAYLVVWLLTGGPGIAKGRSDEAAVALDRALGQYAGGHTEVAYVRIRELLSAGASSPYAFLFAGAFEREAGRVDDACATFFSGVSAYPNHGPLLMEWAVTLSWLGQFDAAIAAYDRVLDQDPSHAAAQLGKARVLAWDGELARARALFAGLMSSARWANEARLGLALVARTELDRATAQRLYRKVLTDDPENQEAREGLKAAEGISRLDVDLEGGSVVVADSAMAVFAATLRYQVSPSWRLSAAYQLDGMRFVSDPAAARSQRGTATHRVGGMADVRLGESLSVAGGYELQLRDGRAVHAVHLTGAWKLSSDWSLLAGARSFFGDQLGLVANGGVQWTYGRAAFVLVQAFHSMDLDWGSGTIGVVSVQQPIDASWSPKLTVGLGTHDTLGVQSTAAFDMVFAGLPKVELSVGYEFFTASFTTHRVRLGASKRF